MSKIYGIIKERRKTLGLTQKVVSEKLSIPQSHFSKIESGLSDTRMSTIVDICRVLELEMTLVPNNKIRVVRALMEDSYARMDKPAWVPDEEA